MVGEKSLYFDVLRLASGLGSHLWKNIFERKYVRIGCGKVNHTEAYNKFFHIGVSPRNQVFGAREVD